MVKFKYHQYGQTQECILIIQFNVAPIWLRSSSIDMCRDLIWNTPTPHCLLRMLVGIPLSALLGIGICKRNTLQE